MAQHFFSMPQVTFGANHDLNSGMIDCTTVYGNACLAEEEKPLMPNCFLEGSVPPAPPAPRSPPPDTSYRGGREARRERRKGARKQAKIAQRAAQQKKK